MSLLPADIYIVINKTILNENDRKILTNLYQPIIGYEAVSLYFTMWSDLDKLEIMSIEYTHHHLMAMMQKRLTDIEDARRRLEAIGLIKTYLKKGETKSYIYELYSPLNIEEFFNHPILSVVLENNLGEKEFAKLVKYYEIPKINKKDYEDITASFTEVYESKPLTSIETVIDNIKKRECRDIYITKKLDYNLLSILLDKYINENTLTDDIKELLTKLSVIYNLDEKTLSNIIKRTIDNNGKINKEDLRKKTKEFYEFEENGKKPSIIQKSQPDFLREVTDEDTKKTKMVMTFEVTSPYDFLVSKYNGSKPTTRDLKLLETLHIDYELTPGVINVLIDYVLRVNNQKLSKEYIETIAGQWKRLNIMTVKDAMKIAEEEYKKRKNYKTKKEDKTPEWFDKKIKEETVTKEEEEELENLLKKY